MKHSMLADVIGNYVDSLTEREFDAPFIALLGLHAFTDIHFLHGPFEFGKDFIAKRVDDGLHCQYVFQTKAGDIRLAEWSTCRGQIDMLRTDASAHPNFDKDLPRRARFVTTGRLVGAAALAAQEYGQHIKDLEETQFLVWDRDTLVEMLAVDPRTLSGSAPALLQILGSQDIALIFQTLEKYSRSWIRSECGATSLRDSIEAAVIAHHCTIENRLDLACYTPLMLLRSVWATAHRANPRPEAASVAIATGKNLFRHYASRLWQSCSGNYLDPDMMIRDDGTPAGFVTYPVRCLELVEILSLLGLLDRNNDPNLSRELADYLSKFVEANVGAAHPISDRWGTSVACCALQLAVHGKVADLKTYLRSVIKWVADRYDGDSLGLAGPYSDPEEETRYLLGSPFEHTKVSRRPESYTATQLLDLCSVLEDKELFDLARNEFLAVNIYLPNLEVEDTQAQYRLDSVGHILEPNILFEESWNPSERWKVAPHHRRGPDRFYPESIGDAWDQLALSSVLRDRHFVKSWRRLVSPE